MCGPTARGGCGEEGANKWSAPVERRLALNIRGTPEEALDLPREEENARYQPTPPAKLPILRNKQTTHLKQKKKRAKIA